MRQDLDEVVLEVRFVATHHIVVQVAVVAALILSCDPDKQTELIEVVLLDHFAAQGLVFHLVQLRTGHSHDCVAAGLAEAAQVDAVGVVLELEGELVGRVAVLVVLAARFAAIGAIVFVHLLLAAGASQVVEGALLFRVFAFVRDVSDLATYLVESSLVCDFFIVFSGTCHFRDRVEHVFHAGLIRLLGAVLAIVSFAGLCQLTVFLMTILTVPLE